MLPQFSDPGTAANLTRISSFKSLYIQQWEGAIATYSNILRSEDEAICHHNLELNGFKCTVEGLEHEFSLDPETTQSLLSLVPIFASYASSSALMTAMAQSHLIFDDLWGFLVVAIKQAVDPENAKKGFRAVDASKTPDQVDTVSPFSEIVSMLKDLSQKFELIPVYCAKIPDYQGMSQVAVDVHKSLLQFFASIVTCYQGAFYGQAEKERWRFLTERYAATAEELNNAGKRLERLAWSLALSSVSDIQNGASRLILRDSVDPKVKLPYEKLPSRRNPQFYGRKKLLDTLTERSNQGIETSKLTAITIDGLGGVGKTQIALEFAHSQHGKRDAIIWVHSENSIAMNQDLSAAAMDLCLPGAMPREDATNCIILRDWLQTTDASWTIILDNVEEPEMVEEVWPARGRGFILITARKPAVSFQLATDHIEVPPFNDEEGTGLLLSLVARPRDDMEDLAAKCLTEKLGGHALAISQMAAVIVARDFSISSFNETYEKNKKRIHRTHRTTRRTGYSHFLDTVWQLSFKFLSLAGRTLLGIIAIVAPDSIPSRLFVPKKPWIPPADLKFCEDEFSLSEVEEQLLTLALVKKNPYQDEISVHRLVQTEFWYYLPEDERQEAFNNASKLLYESFPKQVSGRLMLDLWSTCQIYEQHVLSLVHLYNCESETTSLKPPLEFCKLMCNVAWYLSERRGLSDELNLLLLVAFKSYDACQDEKKDPISYAHLCNTMGIMTHNKGDFISSKNYLQKCHDIRMQAPDPDPEEMANIYNNLGNVEFSMLECENALLWHKQAEAIRMPKGDEWATSKGMTHLNMGRSLWKTNQKSEAWKRLDFAIAAFEFSGNWYLLSHAHLLVGTFHRESGDLGNAEHHYQLARDIMTADGHAPYQFTTSAILYKLGCVALQREDVDRAINFLRDSLAIAELRAVADGDRARVMHKLAEALQTQHAEGTEANEMMMAARQLRKNLEGPLYDENDQSEIAYDKIVCGNFR
ncbi:hypothetical protein ACLMJK_001863 [Lecanora helva]